jgi:methylenetetrahydrofolate dehydrogenase (NADP+) / methenyltetrahydrofolate cyclohydrolase
VTAKIIDGKSRAKQIRDEIKEQVIEAIKSGIKPKLCVVLVGDDPASHIYVSNKEKDCAEVGFLSETYRLPADAKESDVIAAVEKLNKDRSVHGMIVQLPLPDHISEENVLSKILPSKDVDGLGVFNLGLLFKGEGDPLVSCTPQGCIDLIRSTGVEIKGKNAVVVGRSNIVGKPMAILLLRDHATVTICHSRTVDLPSITSRADILVAAIGKAKMIRADMVKKGAIVIDVGMNRTKEGLLGDVDFENVKEVAGFITPVPGGVGPMTRAMLLKNTLKAALRS